MSKKANPLEALERLMKDYYEMCLDTGNNDDEYQKNNLTSEYHIIEAALKDYEYLDNFIARLKKKYSIDDLDYLEHIVNLFTKYLIVKKLKALEIIKEKRVEIRVIFHTTNAMEYNEKTRQYYDCMPLAQEEYQLLKEVLE